MSLEDLWSAWGKIRQAPKTWWAAPTTKLPHERPSLPPACVHETCLTRRLPGWRIGCLSLCAWRHACARLGSCFGASGQPAEKCNLYHWWNWSSRIDAGAPELLVHQIYQNYRNGLSECLRAPYKQFGQPPQTALVASQLCWPTPGTGRAGKCAEFLDSRIGARENLDNLGRVFGGKNWPRVHNWHKKWHLRISFLQLVRWLCITSNFFQNKQ